jgi:hypothetical protein
LEYCNSRCHRKGRFCCNSCCICGKSSVDPDCEGIVTYRRQVGEEGRNCHRIREENRREGSNKKGGKAGDAPDIATAKSCSRPLRNALGSELAMDLTYQSTVEWRKTRQRGARKVKEKDIGGKIGWTKNRRWRGVERRNLKQPTNRIGPTWKRTKVLSPTLNSNCRQPMDVVPTAVSRLPGQSANSRRLRAI